MIKAVIFDMDGLMIDSERVTFECYQEIMKPMNLTMSEEFYKTLLGKPIKGIYERFGSLTVVSNFSLTKSLKTLIISMLLSFFVVKFMKIIVLIWANVCYNRHRR